MLKVTAQASLLSVSYAVGYGIGSASKKIKEVTADNIVFEFIREMVKEGEKGYINALEEKDVRHATEFIGKTA